MHCLVHLNCSKDWILHLFDISNDLRIKSVICFGREMAQCQLVVIILGSIYYQSSWLSVARMPGNVDGLQLTPTSFFSLYDAHKMPYPGHTRDSWSVGIGRESPAYIATKLNLQLPPKTRDGGRERERGEEKIKWKYKLQLMPGNLGKGASHQSCVGHLDMKNPCDAAPGKQ